MRVAPHIFFLIVVGLVSTMATVHANAVRQDMYTADVERFTALLSSPAEARRIEGIQGLSHLKHWPAEAALLPFMDDSSPEVRREALLAINRIGTAKSIPRLIRLLEDPSWELRQNAWLGLKIMTAQELPADPAAWNNWWTCSTVAAKQVELLEAVSNKPSGPPRRDALRALRHLAQADAEGALLRLLSEPQAPALTLDERSFVAEALDRIGTTQAVPILARERTAAATWALGRIGGPEAERALFHSPHEVPAWINLDRLKSTNAARLLPALVASVGLVTYRSHPDDLHLETAQPVQRAAANLIIRSGQAPKFIDAVLRELEATMVPPITAEAATDLPADWRRMLENMRGELQPGFVRGDGRTTSQPLTALYHVAEDPGLTPRLMPLLRHPAFVPRVYIGMLLGKLRATEAVPLLVEIVREPYTFSDATTLVSGKHSDQSQTVRWKGYLCMALGRSGSDEARVALESLAADPGAARDIRYSAVVGLNFMRSPKSLAVLEQVAQHDIIWMVRDAASQAIADIRVMEEEVAQ